MVPAADAPTGPGGPSLRGHESSALAVSVPRPRAPGRDGRVVHARGAGAYGYFEPYASLSEYTCAGFLAEAGRRTPVFVRFSTVQGPRGLVTDRDLVVRVLAEGGDVGERTVHQACSEELVSVGPDDAAEDAVRLMRRRTVRRLPVVEDGRAVGIVSLGDLAAESDPGSALGEISTAAPNR
ncbi:catalase [Streptomyces nondiastaticus]|uniref:catalase n=1 Tax=Streptomyces nondiastaticus TaxID=3154512 RepID=UPI003430C3F2